MEGLKQPHTTQQTKKFQTFPHIIIMLESYVLLVTIITCSIVMEENMFCVYKFSRLFFHLNNIRNELVHSIGVQNYLAVR